MPPKKQAQAGGSKKAEQKKKEKIIEVSSRPIPHASREPRSRGRVPGPRARGRGGHVSPSLAPRPALAVAHRLLFQSRFPPMTPRRLLSP